MQRETDQKLAGLSGEERLKLKLEMKQLYHKKLVRAVIVTVCVCVAVFGFLAWKMFDHDILVSSYYPDKDGQRKTASYKPVLDRKSIEKINYLAAYIQENYYEEVDEQQLLDGIYKGMYESLDAYSGYYNEEEYKQLWSHDVTGTYSGIGATLRQNPDNGQVTVVEVMEDSPAEEAGIQPGDVIVKADSYPAESMSLSEFVGHLQGADGTQVHLVIAREGERENLEMDVTRRKLVAQSVHFQMFEDHIGYIQITDFTNQTTGQFEAALTELQEQGMKGLIVDLRNNPGGMLDAVTDILDQILPEGLLVYTEDRAGNREEFRSTDEKQLTVPLTVLVNENSASASEIFAGAVKDRGFGTLIGTRTYGKGIVQGIQALEDGSAVKLTVSRYYTPNGICIQGTGIEPDITLKYQFLGEPEQDYSPELDNQIQKAKELLAEEIG